MEKVEAIKKALDALKEGTIAENDEEKEAFLGIYRSLIEPVGGGIPDRYFVLYDLPSYYETQIKVEELFQKPLSWAQYALQNIAHMNQFSIDESIYNYADLVWGLLPCPPDKEELQRNIQKVKEVYNWEEQEKVLLKLYGGLYEN